MDTEHVRKLKQQIFELDGRITNPRNGFTYPGRDADVRELKRLQAEVERVLADEAQRNAVAARAARRAPPAAVLMPTTNIWRLFQRRLADHAIDLSDELRLTVYADGRRPRAYPHVRVVYVPPVLTERTYAITLHEFAHCASPYADSHQHRHDLGPGSISSPIAEIHAWRWAVDRALVWTMDMQLELVDALVSYRALKTCTSDEIEAIDAFMKASAERVRPAPDTLDGRTRRVRHIQREDKVREIQADLAAHRRPLQKAINRLREIGL